jgi:hypothetical protein
MVRLVGMAVHTVFSGEGHQDCSTVEGGSLVSSSYGELFYVHIRVQRHARPKRFGARTDARWAPRASVSGSPRGDGPRSK